MLPLASCWISIIDLCLFSVLLLMIVVQIHALVLTSMTSLCSWLIVLFLVKWTVIANHVSQSINNSAFTSASRAKVSIRVCFQELDKSFIN
jgi:hypothetical protein